MGGFCSRSIPPEYARGSTPFMAGLRQALRGRLQAQTRTNPLFLNITPGLRSGQWDFGPIPRPRRSNYACLTMARLGWLAS